MRASPTVVVWPQERTGEWGTDKTTGKESGWMDGWEEGGKFSLPLSLAVPALSFLERQSIIGDVDQYSRSAPSSIGRSADAQPEPAAVKGSRCLTLEKNLMVLVKVTMHGSFLLHDQIRTSLFAFPYF